MDTKKIIETNGDLLVSECLMHHGTKGQKWGVKNGPPYPLYRQSTKAGRQSKSRYLTNKDQAKGDSKKSSASQGSAESEGHKNGIGIDIDRDTVIKIATTGAIVTAGCVAVWGAYKLSDPEVARQILQAGKNGDKCLPAGLELSRIQTSEKFEDYPFYATYKSHDVDEYTGLFGKNLLDRAAKEAEAAQKEFGKDTTNEELLKKALAAKDKAEGSCIFQVKLKTLEKLSMPSDDNAGKIMHNLMTSDSEFVDDLKHAIDDSKKKMRRPSQQELLGEAQRILKKDPSTLSPVEKTRLYKALNLSLTFHDEQEQRMQGKFYGALKNAGYSAVTDLNDKEYSSYHAKHPVIVFDTDKVMVSSVSQLDKKKVDKLFAKHMTERILKEIPEQLFGNATKSAKIKMEDLLDSIAKRGADYLDS